MKTLTPFALSATCLGLQLNGNQQVEGFVASSAAGSAKRASRQHGVASSFTNNRGGKTREGVAQQRWRSSCGTATCRMMSAGFGQQQEGDSGASRKASANNGKGKQRSARKGRGPAGAGGAASGEAEKKGTGQRQLFMQFTCNRCEGVSQYMINKNAYEDGIVICTCQSCQVRHLIADNLKKMDVPAFGDNIEEYMKSTGTPEEVTKGRAPGLTPEIVKNYNVVMGKDGVLTLSPKDGVGDDDGPCTPPP